MAQKDKAKEEFIEEIRLLQKRITELEILDSEREKAKEVLQESEEKFRAIFNNVNDGLIIAAQKKLAFIYHAVVKIVKKIFSGHKLDDQRI